MVLIDILLLGERKPRLIQGIKLEKQIHFEDLKKEIEEAAKIPAKYQEITFNGEKLPTIEPLRSIEDADELEVKHALLPQWENYLMRMDEFREIKGNRLKKEKAFEANEKAKELYEAKFFSVYASFDSDWLRMRREYANFLDNIPTDIKEAARSFFTRKFRNKLIAIDFKDKPSGNRSGAVCVVSFDDTQRVFYVKTNHNASSISITHRCPMNMIELYIYKLLEILGVGALVEFIPNVVASDKIVYICGEEIVAFETLLMLERAWDVFERKIVKKKEEITRAIIQLSLLTQILGLGDLNPENIGFNATAFTLFVVDFRTGFIDNSVAFEGINRPKTAMSLVAQLRMNLGRFSDLVKDMTFEEQLEITKECIDQLEISSKLDVALAKLDEEKNVFNRADLSFATGAEILKEYITAVREKISKISNL